MTVLRAVDCVHLVVPDLESGLAFYRDRLGHDVVWRAAGAAGLRLPGSAAEIVLSVVHDAPQVDFLVESVPDAVAEMTAAGATVVAGPLDIPVGRVAVVADPFGNHLSVLDLSKGRYTTGDDGTVTGVA
jgi:catechol 2,3-dioxygenase-like lactoylglutathione lyase family enzyme